MKMPDTLMALRRQRAPRPRSIVAIDLGNKATKAVQIEQRGNDLTLCGYFVADTPSFDDGKVTLLDHLKKVINWLGAKGDETILVIEDRDSLFRSLEMPAASTRDLRSMLRLNATALIQHNLSDYCVDCHVLRWDSAEAAKTPSKQIVKSRVLVGGARNELIAKVKNAARGAGLEVSRITLNRVGPMNAFKMAMPEVFQNEVIALVDIGYGKSAIAIFANGSLILHRELKEGGDAFTKSLVEAMKIDSAVAESLKLIMPEKVRAKLEPVVAAFGQEIRASLEFVDYQHEQRVSRVFFSGGSARSEVFLQLIQQEVGVPCRNWDPTRFLEARLPAAQIESLKADAPLLATAVGAAMTTCESHLVQLNLLAEEQQNEELRRDDPVRRGIFLAGAAAIILLIAAGVQACTIHRLERRQADNQALWSQLEARLPEARAQTQLLAETQKQLASLREFSSRRVLCGSALNALQFTSGNDIQLTHLQLEQRMLSDPGPRKTNGKQVSPPASCKRTVLWIQGKNLADSTALENYMHELGGQPYFQDNLNPSNPIRLRDNTSVGIDSGPNIRAGQEPPRAQNTFALECVLSERFL